MILCCALRFVGAEGEAVCELFAGGEMVLCLAHWHLYVLQFDRSFESVVSLPTCLLVSTFCGALVSFS